MISVQIIRNSSRGMFWLEPFVEVETPQGRVGYGPVEPDDVQASSMPDFTRAASIRSLRAALMTLPWLKNQERLTFARAGITDPVSVADYIGPRRF